MNSKKIEIKKVFNQLIGRDFFFLKKKSNSDIYHLVSFEGVCLSVTECSGILPEFPKYQNF